MLDAVSTPSSSRSRDTIPSSKSPASPHTQQQSKVTSSKKPWVDPTALPESAYTAAQLPNVRGNAPRYAVRQALDTFAAYGARNGAGFGASVSQRVNFVKADVTYDKASDSALEVSRVGENNTSRKPTEVVVLAEIVVDEEMTNGNGMLHGGCVAYLMDNVASVPLIVLGAIRGLNTVGVTQALDVLYHAPAPLGTRLCIRSTTLALGSRAMSARCEVVDCVSGRPVATGLLVKMEPRSRL